MPTINIDGRDLEFEPGKKVIEVASRAGIDIPHYCWHPRLSSPASCRMCLVEVEKAPKLLPACEIPCRDGMVVKTTSPKVLEARAAVMEFQLINHPVDCPICDQAGECKLQDYYMAHDRSGSRFTETKVVKEKARVLGPTVILDQERCINCTRCVRFMSEVVKKPLLGQFDRGDRANIDIFPGEPLDHPYSLNVVDICPVGALTSRDFRFKVRSWFLRSANSVCAGCARGCAIRIDHHDNIIARLVGRDTDAVNFGWMCDEGRFTYRRVHDPETRIAMPHVRTDDGRLVPTTWDEAKTRLVELLARYVGEADGTLGLAVSAQQTTEGITAFIELAEQILQVDTYAILGRPDGSGDDFLRVADKNPNRAGAELVLESYSIFDEGPDLLERALERGSVKTLVMLGSDHPRPNDAWKSALAKAKVIVWSSNWDETARAADLVLPLATHAEQDGTFINTDARMQRIHRALAPIDRRKTAIEAATFTANALRAKDAWALGTWVAAFERLQSRTNLLARIRPLDIPASGVVLEAEIDDTTAAREAVEPAHASSPA